MTEPGSITRLIFDVNECDEAAATQLWNRFRDRLVRLAKTRLAGVRSSIADEDDVAIEAFHSLLRGMRAGKYNLPTRDHLWRLLAHIAVRRAQTARRSQQAKKRQGELGESAIVIAGIEEGEGLAGIPDDEPTTETLAELNLVLEEISRLLHDQRDRQIILLKLEGWSHREIAERLGIGLWRVRKVHEVVEHFLTR